MVFNPCNGSIEDSMGSRHLVSRPDVSVLSVAEDFQRSIKPPELVEAAGLKRGKADRSVYVEPTDRKFRRSTGELAPGYGDLV